MRNILLSDIFSDIPEPFRHINITYPWELLDALKNLLKHTIKPNSELKKICGRPLVNTIVINESGNLRELVDDSGYEEAVKLLNEGKVSLIHAGAFFMDNLVHIGKGVTIEPFSVIKGPTFIDDHTEIRHGAYIRGEVFIGKHCVVGHTTEVKNSIFMDHAKAGHFAYVGDSILGNNVNLGAGTKLANLRFLKGNVQINVGGTIVDTGRRKLGAILGDGTQTGCNSVTNPGVITGKQTFIYPNTSIKSGYYPPKSVLR